VPELPEVHTITFDLKKHIIGAVNKDIGIEDGYQVFPDNEKFVDGVTGKKIKDVFRLGKNIVFVLSDGSYLAVHLAMTGRMLLRKVGYRKDSWMRVVFILEKGGKLGELRYCDKRMFGKITLLSEEEFIGFRKKYGFDPLEDDFSAEDFLNLLKLKKTKIKTALLDQSLIAGMGNVYATDVLWMAGIHPEFPTADISLEQARILLDRSREILMEGISNRGVSMSDYVDLFGRSGKQQLYFRIYGKDFCSRCKTKVKTVKINGRRTFFCPVCQSM